MGTPSKKQRQLKDNKRFMAFCVKLHERLTIIFDDNLHKRVDPIEEDIQLLEELYEMYDVSTLPWVRDDIDVAQVVRQSELFSDKTAEKI